MPFHATNEQTNQLISEQKIKKKYGFTRERYNEVFTQIPMQKNFAK